MNAEDNVSRAFGWLLLAVIIVSAGLAVGSGYFIVSLVARAMGLP